MNQFIRRKHRLIHARESGKVVFKSDAQRLIDGNYSRYVVGYCKKYNGYLSLGLYERHECEARTGCKMFRPCYAKAVSETDKL